MSVPDEVRARFIDNRFPAITRSGAPVRLHGQADPGNAKNGH